MSGWQPNLLQFRLSKPAGTPRTDRFDKFNYTRPIQCRVGPVIGHKKTRVETRVFFAQVCASGGGSGKTPNPVVGLPSSLSRGFGDPCGSSLGFCKVTG